MLRLTIVIFFGAISFSSFSYSDDWAGFQKDARHSGNSPVNFSSAVLKPAWTFSPTEKVWNYKRGLSVWSQSACVAEVNGRAIVYAGFYNNNLYAVDALSGELIWRFIAGNSITAAPCFAVVDSRPMLFFASADRTIYALDAATGKKIWNFETFKWSYMVSDAITSSPIVISFDKNDFLVCAVWNSTNNPLNRLQRGELFALDARSGEKIYSRVLSSTPLNSPVFCFIKGRPVMFVSSQDGTVTSLEASNGKEIWQMTACAETYSSVSIYAGGDKTLLFFGSRFGNLYCLNAENGAIEWTAKTGHQLDSTPAIGLISGDPVIYAGSYDRSIYAFDGLTGKKIWNFKTGDYVVSSCAIAKKDGDILIFAHSLDNKLYCLDGRDGALFWSVELGKLIWGYTTRGDTIWSSPAVSVAGGKPLVILPCYDGKLYAYTAGEIDRDGEG